MCFERLSDRFTADVKATETRDAGLRREDEIEWPEVRREPVEEPVETEKELARV